jgi:hypothetical protein
MIPFIIFTAVVEYHNYVSIRTAHQDFVFNIKQVYKAALTNDARFAISTGDKGIFQENIEKLVTESNGNIISIELEVGNQIMARYPINPDISIPAVRIPISMNISASELTDIHGETHEINVGNIIIRFNDEGSQTAIDSITNTFLFIAIIFITMSLIIFYGFKRFILKPINRISHRITDIAQGNAEIICPSQDFMTPIDERLNALIRKQTDMAKAIAVLNEQVTVTRSNVDIANLTKIILLKDLIDKINAPLLNTRELIATACEKNKDNAIGSRLEVIAANIADASKILSNAKVLMEQVGSDNIYEPVSVKAFFDGISDFTKFENLIIRSSINCDDKELESIIHIDRRHIYQLIGKVFSLAAITGRPSNEIFLAVRFEFKLNKSLHITIDIKDCGKGWDTELVTMFNQYMNGSRDICYIDGYPTNDLQMIQFLVSSGHVMISASSKYGRGNNYEINVDLENYTTPPVAVTAPRINGAILHNGVYDAQLPEHFRSLGIDVRHILQFDAMKLIPEIAKLDFLIVDFTDKTDTTLELCGTVKKANHDINIIPAYRPETVSKTQVTDALFDMGIINHLAMPYGAYSILKMLRSGQNNQAMINKILDSYINPT